MLAAQKLITKTPHGGLIVPALNGVATLEVATALGAQPVSPSLKTTRQICSGGFFELLKGSHCPLLPHRLCDITDVAAALAEPPSKKDS